MVHGFKRPAHLTLRVRVCPGRARHATFVYQTEMSSPLQALLFRTMSTKSEKNAFGGKSVTLLVDHGTMSRLMFGWIKDSTAMYDEGEDEA